MKTPIEFKDIRVGDVVQREHGGISSRLTVGARNEVGVWSEKDWSLSAEVATPGDTARWYLIDRPTPPVELPTEPTLGWLTGPETAPLFDSWVEEVVTTQGPPPGTYATGHLTGSFVAIREITDFTPAVAVPKAALDKLRAIHDSPDYDTRAMARAAAKFLTAADKANA